MMEPVARIDAEALKELEKHPGASATVWSGKASHRFALDAVPLVRLSDAEARIKELELDLRIAIEQRNMTLTEMQRHMDRAEAAEALLKEAGEALDGMLQYAGIIEERCGNVETVLARRAARAIHRKIGVKDE